MDSNDANINQNQVPIIVSARKVLHTKSKIKRILTSLMSGKYLLFALLCLVGYSLLLLFCIWNTIGIYQLRPTNTEYTGIMHRLKHQLQKVEGKSIKKILI